MPGHTPALERGQVVQQDRSKIVWEWGLSVPGKEGLMIFGVSCRWAKSPSRSTERIIDQALAFLGACVLNPGESLTPSPTVDLGWHVFLIYTDDYAAFCQNITERFIHHVPNDSPNAPQRSANRPGSRHYRHHRWSEQRHCHGCPWPVRAGGVPQRCPRCESPHAVAS